MGCRATSRKRLLVPIQTPMATAATPPTRSWALAMQLAFVGGDLEHALNITEAATAEVGPLQVLDEVVAPAMHHVGLLWERDMITVADEHLATATVHRLLAAVTPSLGRAAPGSRGALAVLAAPPSERHTTGLLMAEAVLRGSGYDVKCLGGGVPLPDLLGLVERECPAVVALTATMPAGEELRATLRGLRVRCPDAYVIAGGRYHPAAVVRETGVERVEDLRGLAGLLTL